MPTHKPDISRLSINQLSQITGAGHARVKRALEGLAPAETDGRTLKYATRKALPLIFEQGATPQQERARLDKLRADVIELDLSEREGQLVPVEMIGEQIDKLFMGVRSHLLALPTKAAPAVHGCKSIGGTAKEIEKYIYEALTELSTIPIEELMKKATK